MIEEFLSATDQVFAVLSMERKEEWRKEESDNSLSVVQNDLLSGAATNSTLKIHLREGDELVWAFASGTMLSKLNLRLKQKSYVVQVCCLVMSMTVRKKN